MPPSRDGGRSRRSSSCVLLHKLNKLKQQHQCSVHEIGTQQMLQLGVYNDLVMELATDGGKSDDFCMSDEQQFKVLTFVGPVITNKTGRKSQHMTSFYGFPTRSSHDQTQKSNSVRFDLDACVKPLSHSRAAYNYHYT